MKTDVERIVAGLMEVQSGKKHIDTHTETQLILLKLIESTQDASFRLTQKGEEILSNKEKGVPLDHAEQIKRNVERLIGEHYNDDSICEALGIDEYQTLGKNGNMSDVGRYLGKISPDDVLPTASVLGDTLRVLVSVTEGLSDKKNNKVFVKGTGVNPEQGARLIRHSVKNFGTIIAGENPREPITFVDLSFIGNIAFSKFVDHDDIDTAIYYTVRYILQGESHAILSNRLGGRRMMLAKPTLKEAIDSEIAKIKFQASQYKSASRIIIVSEPIQGGTEWNKSLVRELERNRSNAIYRDDSEGDFMDFLTATPCLFINESGSSEFRTSREYSLDFGGLADRSSLKIFGATDGEITGINLKLFVSRASQLAKLKPIGGNIFKPAQIEELSSHLKSQQERILFMLGYMLERCEGIDGVQLSSLMSLLIEFGVRELPEKIIAKIRKKTRMSDELIEKFRVRSEEYTPKKYMSNFPSGVGYLLSEDARFFHSSYDYLGLAGEIDSILLSLEKGNTVVYIDETGYKDSHGENGDYTPIRERIRTGIVERIMSGDVPDALRNHSVVLIEPQDEEGESMNILSLLLGLVSQGTPINLNMIREELKKFVRYNPKTILILNLDLDDFDADGIGEFIRLVQAMGIKLIIDGKKDIPGTGKSVRTTPITEDDLSDRIIEEIDELEYRLSMKLDTRVCRKLFSTVARYRKDGDDPLWMVYEILKVAKNSALGKGSKAIVGSDVSAGISYVLGVASIASMEENRVMIARLPAILKKRIVGQDEVIDEFCREFMNHMTGGGNPERPLSYLFPGPTGVGKTLFAEVTGRNFNLPLLSIDGSQYRESHTGQRLSGSPQGYVDSDKPGILTGFMKDNPGRALVFVDEIDKMHPSVRLMLMNFFDEGKMTDGHGRVYRRPQYTIIVATNAGAENLRHGMSQREILDCIGEAFKDENGVPKPELASRFRISPMLPVDESSFKRAIRDNLREIELRARMVANNIEITDVDAGVVDFVFGKIKDVCQKFGGSNQGIGFTLQEAKSDGYFNLREIVRCIDANIDGENLPTASGSYRVILQGEKINLTPVEKIERKQ